ncbi:hypothetical protein [Pseudoalteromonas sp. S16_S37]|uniref:hypothetical protein n=1 Tax=Pseudoalteromonas sp. S16_S37 TaxID=2720228 RepID=UPI0016807009|nr:hypothetical protein [Pseudoalteromonas sp. S16_S37]MBD1584965.1 hypothetical protein [Pseudoalteromonas sp. S16_S37]
MFKVIASKQKLKSPIGQLQLDIDTNATRIAVQNRLTLKAIWQGAIPNNGQMTIITPEQYGIEPDLMVTIFDDSGEFNAETVDRVQAKLPSQEQESAE